MLHEFLGPGPTLTGSDHPVADAGDAHWLQLDPGLSVGVVERTHAARVGSRLPGSGQNSSHQSRQDVSWWCD